VGVAHVLGQATTAEEQLMSVVMVDKATGKPSPGVTTAQVCELVATGMPVQVPGERRLVRAARAKKPPKAKTPAKPTTATATMDDDAHLTLLGRHDVARIAAARQRYAERHRQR
jgi:hypothetical protein